MSHDKCLNGLGERWKSDKRFRRKRGREQSDEVTGRALLTVSAEALKEWMKE